MSQSFQPSGPHDLGGLPGGPLDREESDIAYWERRIEAALYLAFKNGLLDDTAELRAGIEALGADVYERLSYYERWAASLAARMVEKGIIDQTALNNRIEQLAGQ